MGVGALAVIARRAPRAPRAPRARALSRCVALLTLFTLQALLPRGARAHVIHTTYTLIAVGAGGRTVTVSIRAFADDFSAAAARLARKPAPRDSSVSATDADAYLRAHFGLDGIRLVSCGVRRAGDAYLLCLRGTLAPGASLRVRNRLLMEVHEDQVNIVQLQGAGRQRTQLFTRATPVADLGSR